MLEKDITKAGEIKLATDRLEKAAAVVVERFDQLQARLSAVLPRESSETVTDTGPNLESRSPLGSELIDRCRQLESVGDKIETVYANICL
jgi:hypothetical protein